MSNNRVELIINLLHDDNTMTNEYKYRQFAPNFVPTPHQLGLLILNARAEARKEFPNEDPPIVLDITLT